MAKIWVCEAVAQTTVGQFREESALAAGLKALYFLSDVHSARLREIGLAKVAAAAIKAHGDNDEIVRYSCELLLVLHYTSEEDRAMLVAKGAVDVSTGRVTKMGSADATELAWIPEDVVKANEWFTTGAEGEDAEVGNDANALVEGEDESSSKREGTGGDVISP